MAPQREWFDVDYYAALGVSKNATAKDITKAYRKLARDYHPDANPGDASAEERFKVVSSAYDVLGDDKKRKEYDQVRRLGPAAAGFSGGAGGFNFEADDLGDLLGGLFGRGRRRSGQRPSSTGPQRGSDVETELHLSFDDAVLGVTTAVNLVSDAPCRTCRGSGAAPGTSPARCSRCDGRGALDDNQGLFSFSSPCPTCGGQGTVIESPCADCAGSGTERRPREVKIRVPAGVDDGQRIRLKGRGAPGRNGGPPGDLYVATSVAAHPRFGRRGSHLTCVARVSYPEAVLGGQVAIETLDGDRVTLKIPPGTRSGRTLRVRGRGIASGGRKGDLLVTVEIAVPTNPSAAERAAIEALAKVTESEPTT